MVHLLPMDWTTTSPAGHRGGVGVRQRRHRRALPQRPVPRRAAFDAQEDHRRPRLPGDHRGDRRRQDRHLRSLPRQLHQPQRQRRQAASDLEGAVRGGRAEGRRPRAAGRSSPPTCCAPPATPHAVRLTADRESRRTPTGVRWSSSPPRWSTRAAWSCPTPSTCSPSTVDGRLAGRVWTTGGRRAPSATRPAPAPPSTAWRSPSSGRAPMPGALTVTATRGRAARRDTVSVRATGPAGRAPSRRPHPFAPDPGPGAPNYPLADASYSGAPDTLPAAMLDGDPATGWSNAFQKAATALLPAFDGARPTDWVSVAWAQSRETVDRSRSPSPSTRPTPCPPRSTSRSGTASAMSRCATPTSTGPRRPARRPSSPSTRSTAHGLRLDLTSRRPGEPAGAIGIVALDAAAS